MVAYLRWKLLNFRLSWHLMSRVGSPELGLSYYVAQVFDHFIKCFSQHERLKNAPSAINPLREKAVFEMREKRVKITRQGGGMDWMESLFHGEGPT